MRFLLGAVDVEFPGAHTEAVPPLGEPAEMWLRGLASWCDVDRG